MRNIEPRIVGELVRVAEKQPEYLPVTALLARHPKFAVDPLVGYNSKIMCFEFTADDRQRIVSLGENLYIALLTKGAAQQPVLISVGPEDMARWHGLEVKPRVLDLRDMTSCEGVRFEGL